MFSHLNTMETNSTFNYSDEEKQSELEELIYLNTVAIIPVAVFCLSLSVIGVVGNSTILYVYTRKFKSPLGFFIQVLACYDLLSNIVLIPADLHNLFNQWNFYIPMLCKARVFVYSFSIIGSSTMLLAIAVTRYRKVCRPFSAQVTVTHAKISSVAVMVFSLVSAFPYGVLNGIQTKKTRLPGYHSYSCGMDDRYLGTKWAKLYSAYALFLYLIVSTSMVTLYCLIGLKAGRRRKLKYADTPFEMCCSREGHSSKDKVDYLDCFQATIGVDDSTHDSKTKLNFNDIKIFTNPVFEERRNIGCSAVVQIQTLSKAGKCRSLENTSEASESMLRLNLSDKFYFPTLSYYRRCHSACNLNYHTASMLKQNLYLGKKASIIENLQEKTQELYLEHGTVNMSHSSDNFVESNNRIASNDGKINVFKMANFNKSTQSMTTNFFPSNDGVSFSKSADPIPRQNRTTKMLLSITLVYIFTYLCFLFLEVVREVTSVSVVTFGVPGFCLYNLFYRVFLVNTAVNPFIYNFYNAKFRTECRKLFTGCRLGRKL
ncbi:uncharacterized protein LOC131955206 [Physella acuta]|uniref:uncharacterized protein LOC131955206 n=1 Tax=Physella acuta TaxID=109671 RepID=UPI0027DC1B8A|nr:uncharacterized protein LOC131955206 [Physella acuta]